MNAKLKTWKVPENEFTAKEKVTLRRAPESLGGTDRPRISGLRRQGTDAVPGEVLDGGGNTAPVRVDVFRLASRVTPAAAIR